MELSLFGGGEEVVQSELTSHGWSIGVMSHGPLRAFRWVAWVMGYEACEALARLRCCSDRGCPVLPSHASWPKSVHPWGPCCFWVQQGLMGEHEEREPRQDKGPGAGVSGAFPDVLFETFWNGAKCGVQMQEEEGRTRVVGPGIRLSEVVCAAGGGEGRPSVQAAWHSPACPQLTRGRRQGRVGCLRWHLPGRDLTGITGEGRAKPPGGESCRPGGKLASWFGP